MLEINQENVLADLKKIENKLESATLEDCVNTLQLLSKSLIFVLEKREEGISDLQWKNYCKVTYRLGTNSVRLIKVYNEKINSFLELQSNLLGLNDNNVKEKANKYLENKVNNKYCTIFRSNTDINSIIDNNNYTNNNNHNSNSIIHNDINFEDSNITKHLYDTLHFPKESPVFNDDNTFFSINQKDAQSTYDNISNDEFHSKLYTSIQNDTLSDSLYKANIGHGIFNHNNQQEADQSAISIFTTDGEDHSVDHRNESFSSQGLNNRLSQLSTTTTDSPENQTYSDRGFNFQLQQENFRESGDYSPYELTNANYNNNSDNDIGNFDTSISSSSSDSDIYDNTLGRYICCKEFMAQEDSQIDLQVNDIVTVTSFTGHFMIGHNYRTDKEGLFPIYNVQSLNGEVLLYRSKEENYFASIHDEIFLLSEIDETSYSGYNITKEEQGIFEISTLEILNLKDSFNDSTQNNTNSLNTINSNLSGPNNNNNIPNSTNHHLDSTSLDNTTMVNPNTNYQYTSTPTSTTATGPENTIITNNNYNMAGLDNTINNNNTLNTGLSNHDDNLIQKTNIRNSNNSKFEPTMILNQNSIKSEFSQNSSSFSSSNKNEIFTEPLSMPLSNLNREGANLLPVSKSLPPLLNANIPNQEPNNNNENKIEKKLMDYYKYILELQEKSYGADGKSITNLELMREATKEFEKLRTKSNVIKKNEELRYSASDIENKVKKREANRYRCIELVKTEESYCKQLKILIDKIMKPIEDAVDTNEEMLNRTQISLVFKNIPGIYAFSVKLHQEISKGLIKYEEEGPIPIAKIFLNKFSDWKIYIKYVEDYQRANETLDNMEKNPQTERFQRFMDQCQKSKEVNRSTIKDFLILPIQRFLRYRLLFNGIKKDSDPMERESYQILDAVESYIFEIGEIMNSAKQIQENINKMFTVQRAVFNSPPSLISFTQRKFIGEWEIFELRKKIMYLFSDTIMIAGMLDKKTRKNTKYKYVFDRLLNISEYDVIQDPQKELQIRLVHTSERKLVQSNSDSHIQTTNNIRKSFGFSSSHLNTTPSTKGLIQFRNAKLCNQFCELYRQQRQNYL